MWCRRLAVLAVLVTAAQLPAATVSAAASAKDNGADREVALVGEVPTTARQANPRAIGCTDWATGPYAGLDLWRFGPAEGAGRITRIDVGFLAADGSAYSRQVEGQDAVITDAGATLVRGTARIDGDAGAYRVILACPGTKAAIGALAPVVPRIGAQPPARAMGPAPKALAAGADVGATVTVGCALVLAGVLLMIVRRNPRGRHRRKHQDPRDHGLTVIQRP